MVSHNGLDCDRVQFLAIREDDDVVGPALILPVIWQTGVRAKEIAGWELILFRKRVEATLDTCRGLAQRVPHRR